MHNVSTTATTTRWSNEKLDAMRLVGDPTADAVIKALSDAQEEAASRLFGKMMRTDDPVPAGLPAEAERYFVETATLPPWADPELIRQGERVFAKYGLELTASLFCAALPQCYAAKKGVLVLTSTGRMLGHGLERRIMETAQFLVDVVDEGGLEPNGRGVRAAQKVRLMHAGVRELVRENAMKIGYDEAERGVPVCQEDLAFTLMTFSFVMIEALARMGIPISTSDKEAWIHCWRVVGYLMGVLEENNPVDYADAERFTEAFRAHSVGASEEGALLTKSLVDFMKREIPGRAFDGIPAALIRHLNGDALAEMLGVERSPWIGQVIGMETRFFHAMNRAVPGGVGLRPALGAWLDELIRAVAVANRHGKEAPFRIPNELAKARRGPAAT